MFMKKRQLFLFIALLGSVLALQSCRRSSNDVWEDTKSAGRHVKRGVGALGGKHGDSRQVRSRNDFACVEDGDCCSDGEFQSGSYQEDPSLDNSSYYSPGDFSNPSDGYSIPQDNYGANNDFIPLQDPNNEIAMADSFARPPRETPGEQGSSIPGIQSFRDPSMHPQLAPIFRPIYFDYDSSFVKGQQNLQIVRTIGEYLRSHPNVYLFVEGHTDERGPQAYNLALGSRRANAIRNLLVNEGISPDRIFTISYGKERPVILEQHEEGWAKNRRGEFKIYEK